MLASGIINPQVLALVARVRHTNSLVIADWAFPSWPGLETVDLSLTAGIPTVLQVLEAILPNWVCGAAFLAEEFQSHNPPAVRDAFARVLGQVSVNYEPHVALKRRVPTATGLIRTGDTTIYSNLVLVSG